MSRFFATAPDPLDVVVGSVRAYSCPDLAAIDAFITDISARILTSQHFPKLLAQYRGDQDLLLDRRLWLEMTGAKPDGMVQQ